MSESILKALMQLFAIIARPDSGEESRRPLVEDFLKQQLNQELVDEYLLVFDNYYSKNQKKNSTDKRQKHISSSSVRVLTICTVINKELTKKQKSIVVLRLLEFIFTEKHPTDQELEFVQTVAETFNVTDIEYKQLQQIVFETYDNIPDSPYFLLIFKHDFSAVSSAKYLNAFSFDTPLFVLKTQSSNMYISVYHGDNEIYLNGQLMHKDRVYVLSTGSSIRDVKRKPIYYSDIVAAFLDDDKRDDIIFEARNISYKFKNGTYGVNQTSFIEKSGKLVGLMGGSGSGKSTLLNVLNGSITPTTGIVFINGCDIHKEPEQIEGIIGFVSQDDLLIEDLTVFENLYFNAKLCFGNYNKRQLFRLVISTLKILGLFSIKDLKVGSPLNKKISGGQRKRLNIALELIREPAVLFLDEPTSGLSSRDSELILDILKELALKGKLIFVVIHQPSSEIFKMFDRLMIIDQGGYVVYDGDPVESVVYFKSGIKQADWNSGECPVCGNVNPEQVFNILESQVLDEFGNRTSTRKVSPSEWFSYFRKYKQASSDGEVNLSTKNEKSSLPEISFKIPSKFKQFLIFSRRDLLSKLANSQYLLINLLEAPILAFLLSYIIKYYSIENEAGYIFSKNENIPIYIFMAVIVALFVGLTLSADEIIKDRKILKRESFLNLSRFSYLSSKIVLLFALAAYQAFVFVIIGNTILEIREMYWDYWLVLFSTWAFAILLGLNISDGFKTSVTIYISIPFLIIPQIILSGIIVQYEKLNPTVSTPESIPWYGEIMTARWAYEALAVNQFMNNSYEKQLYKEERVMRLATFKKDIWLKEIESNIGIYEGAASATEKTNDMTKSFNLIIKELALEIQTNKAVVPKFSMPLEDVKNLTPENLLEIRAYMARLSQFYIQQFNEAYRAQQKYVNLQTATDSMNELYTNLKMNYHNERLAEFVTNKNEVKKTLIYRGRIINKTDMIYQYPQRFVKAHFYAPKKRVFAKYYDTFSVNVAIIWIYTLFLAVTLQYRFFGKFLELPKGIKALILKRKSNIL